MEFEGATTLVLDTAAGPIVGRVRGGVVQALGIPYALPVTPGTRFLPAVGAPPWQEPWQAEDPGPIAPQHGLRNAIETDESCHRLHIWAPRGEARPRPVIVWLHGGGWYKGQPVTERTDGFNLAATADVVVVSVTHRLGLLGCLYLGDHLGDDYLDSGTAVIDDLVLALEWIRDHIAAFGGDPDNVTIVGCSGGGAKVAALFAIPAARRLVRRAVVQSGSAEHYLDQSEGVELTDRTLHILGLSRERAGELLTLPVSALMAAQEELFRQSPWTPILGTATGLLPFPTVNGRTLPALPRELLTDSDDPRELIIGSAWEEAVLSLARRPAVASMSDVDVTELVRPNLGDAAGEVVDVYRRRMPGVSALEVLIRLGSDVESVRAHRLARARTTGGPTRVYRLDWGSSAYDGVPRACHCLEVGLQFRNHLQEPTLVGQPGADVVSDLFSTALVDFARGVDLRVGNTEWSPFTAAHPAGMVVSAEPFMEAAMHADVVEIWQPYLDLVRR